MRRECDALRLEIGPLRERCTQQQDASRELVGIRDELVAQLHAQRAARRTELTLTLALALALALTLTLP